MLAPSWTLGARALDFTSSTQLTIQGVGIELACSQSINRSERGGNPRQKQTEREGTTYLGVKIVCGCNSLHLTHSRPQSHHSSTASNPKQTKMQETDLHYPPESCPFCTIASAYPVPNPTSPNNVANGLWSKQKTAEEELRDAVPSEEECGVDRTSPSSFVVLRSRDVVAFLDILPMVGGEFCFPFRYHNCLVGECWVLVVRAGGVSWGG